MYLHGHYYNEQNERIEVHIVTHGDKTDNQEISKDTGDIQWTDDPVEIESQVSDTFDVLLPQQATIRLQVRNFVADLFCADLRDAVVNIYHEGECLFAGFLEPQTYSQGYSEEFDEIELSCIDVLTALKSFKYGDVGSAGRLYHEVKANARQRSFQEMITEMLTSLTSHIDILGGHSMSLCFDGSKAIDNQTGSRYRIFSQLSINELLFLSDEEDNVWTQEEVLSELSKYLNLHVLQLGFTFYIFSWESVKRAASITWQNLLTGQTSETPYRKMDIRTGDVIGDDTTMSIGEVYNQLLLTCKVEKMEQLIESPLEDSALRSDFPAKQKYMNEFISWGTGKRAAAGFRDLVFNSTTAYDAASIIDWYVWVKRHPNWTFPMHDNSLHAGMSLPDYFGQAGRNQQAYLQWLGGHLGAALVAYGKVATEMARGDNSPLAKIDMDNYLVLSVNGNGKDDAQATYPQDADLRAAIPYAVYEGKKAGGVFSPADEQTTNYIVLSGKMILNPIMAQTAAFRDLRTKEWTAKNLFSGKPIEEGKACVYGNVVKDKNGSEKYYTCKYWKQTDSNPKQNEEPQWDEDGDGGWYPFTGTAPENYEYNYSAVGDGSDRISKIGVVACMLIVGDKCVVEKGSGSQIEDFEWRKYKERSACSSDDEYYQQSFTIGFDPKIGDKLIGREYSLQNNISWRRGIDTEGMAIPIRKRDHVSGSVRFVILGPVNVLWGDITRRHPTFFRHTKWTEHAVPLLAHVSSIQIKQFEVKLHSDNGLIEHLGDEHDIIYMSDAKTSFCNKKDDLEFKITSALTYDESVQLGIVNTPSLSTPVNMASGDGVLQVCNTLTGQQAKAEQLYVDAYYREYHAPRVVLKQTFADRAHGIVDLFTHYRQAFMGKTFFVQAINRNLTEGSAELTLKEIDND